MLTKCNFIAVGLLSCLALSSTNQFAKDCLEAHNLYRAFHQTPPLTLDSNVQEFSQSWADFLAASTEFYHSSNNEYGENIFTSWGYTNVNGSEAVKLWYDEIKLYDNNKPDFSKSTGHFTQVIWRNTKRLGCALAINRNSNRAFVVANYYPPGNYFGEFSKNVLPPLINSKKIK